MTETLTMDRTEGRFHTLFEKEDLALPPLPRALEERMRQVGETIWATRAPSAPPYDLGESALEAVRMIGADEDFALVGMDGHGFNSWALHYFIMQPGLALFLQMPWGGIYTDKDKARERIAKAFGKR